jgi:hypothetical protein
VGQNHIIELNGKQYNAVTGELLGESKIKATPETRAKHQHHGRNVDGFFRSNKASTLAPTVVKPAPVQHHEAVQQSASKAVPKRMDIRAPKQVKAHQPEKAKTLMRHAVAKPKVEMKKPIKTAVPSEIAPKTPSEIAKPLEKKVSVTNVDPIRLARSRQVARSHHIRRYSGRQQPQQHQVAVQARPVAVQHSVRPAPVQKTSPSPALQQVARQQVTRQKASDVFEAALAHANSHQEPLQPKQGKRARRQHKFAGVMAGIAAFLVIGGFLTYLNMPAIEMRMASMRAGFHAQMPDYKPTGYALDGGVKSEKGAVRMTFRSGDSAYTVTQVASDWNSATLLDQNTEQRGAPDQTVQSKGRIIYIYDNSTATWVDSGVRYEINGAKALDSTDLVSLATSM